MSLAALFLADVINATVYRLRFPCSLVHVKADFLSLFLSCDEYFVIDFFCFLRFEAKPIRVSTWKTKESDRKKEK